MQLLRPQEINNSTQTEVERYNVKLSRDNANYCSVVGISVPETKSNLFDCTFLNLKMIHSAFSRTNQISTSLRSRMYIARILQLVIKDRVLIKRTFFKIYLKIENCLQYLRFGVFNDENCGWGFLQMRFSQNNFRHELLPHRRFIYGHKILQGYIIMTDNLKRAGIFRKSFYFFLWCPFLTFTF